MATLQRAVAFAQGNTITMLVSKDLHLDVTRTENKLFQVNVAVAKRCKSLVLRSHELGFQIGRIMHFAHALTAAAGRCLDKYRIAHFFSELTGFFDRFDNAVRTWHRRNTAGLHGVTGGSLVAHSINALGRRTNEHQIVVGAGTSEIGVFSQEAVAGVDSLAASVHRRSDNGRHYQVAFIGRSRTDAYFFIRIANRIRIGILR